MDAGSADSAWRDSEHLEANRRESRALRQLAAQARGRARAARHQVRVNRSRREAQGDSASAWLEARMGTMPVIEQAKGIIIALQGCGPEEAFDVLRRASQQANIKLHVLAAQIVEQTAASSNHDNVTSIMRGAIRYQRPRLANTPPGPD